MRANAQQLCHGPTRFQVSEALETVIGTVHHYPAQPWLPLLHLGLPWASKVRQPCSRASMNCQGLHARSSQ